MSTSIEMAVSHALKVRGWTTQAECRLLSTLAAKVPLGGVILEIGSYCGRSTLALALPTNALVISIDSYEGGNESPLGTWLAATQGLRNVLLWRADSRKTLVHWDIPLAGLVVDGDHTAAIARADLFGYSGFAPGWIAAHDYTSAGVVVAINDFLATHPEYTRAEVVWAFQVLRRRLEAA